MTPLAPKLVGARVPRLEDPRLLTGQGSYVDDHRPARMLHAAFLRTPHAHARIARIDAAAGPPRPRGAAGPTRRGPGAPVFHEEAGGNLLLAREFACGDVDRALAGAHLVVRERFRFHRHTAVCLENRGALAEYAGGTGAPTLRSSAQRPGLVRDILADLLDVPEHLIRVVAADVGGGFGAKASLYPEEIAVCVLARRLGRPGEGAGG